ncbi:MAG: hypothetical protein PUF13_04500 [Lachnospiraceae bacterium]|nr:hypothetical protein [Lachnospiraceae bacterium]
MRIDGEFWELLSGCPRVFLFSLTGQIMILMLCDRMLVRRRNSLRLLACLSLKTIVSTIVVGTVLQYYYPEAIWEDFLGVFSHICTLFLCYISFVQTYYGGLLKCLIAENICEIMTSILLLPGLILTSYLEGRADLFTVYGKLQLGDCIYYILMLLMAEAAARAAAPLLKRFRTYRFRNKKAEAVCVIVFVGSLQIMGVSDLRDGQTVVILFYMVFLIYALAATAVFVLMYLYQRQRIRTEHAFLDMQLHLMESHYASIQGQIRKMEHCQRIIDEQMKEIEESKNLSQGKAAAYLEQLKKGYDEMRAGMYCDDWSVDALLYCQSEMARAQGISAEYSLSEYDRGRISEDELVYILFRLFEYGMKANQKIEKEREKKISLRMGSVCFLQRQNVGCCKMLCM